MLNLRHFWTNEAYLIWKLYKPPTVAIADLDTPAIDFDDVEVDKAHLDEAQDVINR